MGRTGARVQQLGCITLICPLIVFHVGRSKMLVGIVEAPHQAVHVITNIMLLKCDAFDWNEITGNLSSMY